jgi:peptidoglycan/LPS O-acetylase OafA/YrhL
VSSLNVSDALPGDAASGVSLGMHRFAELDAVRGLAATAVVATHVAFQTGRYNSGPFDGALSRLDFGVTLFFLLSGFLLFRPWLIARTHRRRTPASAGYLWRRALRILPAYWLAVVAAMVLIQDNDISSASTWVRHLTFTQIYGSGHLTHGLTQTWSLATEVAFYLCLPLFAALLLGRRAAGWRPGRILTGLAGFELVTLGWLTLVTHQPELQVRAASTWLPGHLGWFAAGMALAVVQVDSTRDGAREHRPFAWVRDAGDNLPANWLIAVGLFVLATGPLAGPRTLDAPTGWEAVAKHLLYGGAALFFLLPLVMAPLAGGPIRLVLALPPLRWLGEVSYGVFLYHLVVLHLVFRWTDRPLFSGTGFLPVFALTFAGAVIAATASYLLLERRALRAKSRFGRGPSTIHAAPTPASPSIAST